jgi:DNA processing protein
MNDSLLHQIALTLVPQVGAMTAKVLVSYCGSAAGVFQATRKELAKIPGIGPIIVENLQLKTPLEAAERELGFLEKNGVETLFYTHPKYPARLRQCADCPALIFFKGSDAQLLSGARMLAVIGTRQPTEHGRAICEEIVEGLKAYNVTIVSGLAYGIDITAHRKAVAAEMPNIGVMGNGLGSIYPAQHRSTALRMIEYGGLVSEFLSETKPDRENFPMRNRIIAGLCDGILVVETGQTGGSMITAELGAQYGRDVFALPGRVRDPKSLGCNLLIKNGTAGLVESASDIAETLRWTETSKPRAIQKELFVDLSTSEQQALNIIREKPEIAVDELSQLSGLSAGELAAALLGLEFKGMIYTLPGKRYIVAG